MVRPGPARGAARRPLQRPGGGVGGFFTSIGETLDIDESAPTEFLANADRVVVLGSLHARVKETGRSYDNEWVMVWTLGDGKVAGCQIYEDTARELAAHA